MRGVLGCDWGGKEGRVDGGETGAIDGGEEGAVDLPVAALDEAVKQLCVSTSSVDELPSSSERLST